jgi:hypothetical protein
MQKSVNLCMSNLRIRLYYWFEAGHEIHERLPSYRFMDYQSLAEQCHKFQQDPLVMPYI